MVSPHLVTHDHCVMLHAGQVKEALEFVQEELPPLCEDNPQLLDELECTLALLAFETAPSMNSSQGCHPHRQLLLCPT